MIEIFKSIVSASGLTLNSYFIALGCSLFCGLIVLLATAFRNNITKSFAVTVLLLPAIVQTVISAFSRRRSASRRSTSS